MNAAELSRALIAAKAEIDAALVQFEAAIREDAIKADEARKARARAYVQGKAQLGSKATVPEINAYVDLETSNQQLAAHLAEGLRRSAAAAVESKRGWMSALQSLASLTKAEAQIAAWEPSETRSA